MDRKTLLKTLATALLLVLIDRVEFAYYPFEGVQRYVPFLTYATPIILSWYVYVMSILVQQFLWIVLLWMWLPMGKQFKWVVIAFFLCILEFPITYGQPIASLPLPWSWYFPISCSLLRLAAILYYLGCVIKKMI
jgi:hypothetical protein